jgi:hypothetical protein
MYSWEWKRAISSTSAATGASTLARGSAVRPYASMSRQVSPSRSMRSGCSGP